MGDRVLRAVQRRRRSTGDRAAGGQLRQQPAGRGGLRRPARRHRAHRRVDAHLLPPGRVRRRAARHRSTPTRPEQLVDFLAGERVPAGAAAEPVRVPGSTRRWRCPTCSPSTPSVPDDPYTDGSRRHRRQPPAVAGRSGHRSCCADPAAPLDRARRWRRVPVRRRCAVFYVVAARSRCSRRVLRRRRRSATRCARPGSAQVLWFTLLAGRRQHGAHAGCVGFAPAYVLARYRFPGRRRLLGRRDRAVHAAHRGGGRGVPRAAARLAGTAPPPRSIVAHVFFNIAVVVRLVGAMWAVLPTDLTAAARTLGRLAGAGAAPRGAAAAAARRCGPQPRWCSCSRSRRSAWCSCSAVRRTPRSRWRSPAGPPSSATSTAPPCCRCCSCWCSPWWCGGRRAWQRRAAVALRRRAPPRVGPRSAAASDGWVAVVRRGHRSRRWLLPSWCWWPARSGWAGSGRSPPGARSAHDRVRPGHQPRASTRWASLAVSLRFAVVATVDQRRRWAGSPSLAIAAARRHGRLLDVGLMLPLGTSAVTIGLGMLITFDQRAVRLARRVVAGAARHALVAMPFVVRSVLPVLRAVPPDQRAAAITLGASPLRAWWEVEVRRLRRPLAAGAGLRRRHLARRVRGHHVPHPRRAARRCRSPSTGCSAAPASVPRARAFALGHGAARGHGRGRRRVADRRRRCVDARRA